MQRCITPVSEKCNDNLSERVYTTLSRSTTKGWSELTKTTANARREERSAGANKGPSRAGDGHIVTNINFSPPCPHDRASRIIILLKHSIKSISTFYCMPWVELIHGLRFISCLFRDPLCALQVVLANQNIFISLLYHRISETVQHTCSFAQRVV